MDGIQVLNEALEIDPALGVIMVTAVKEEGIAKKAIEHGAFDYITKPIDLDYLRKSVVVKMIQMLGSENVAQFSSGIKENKKKSFVNKWPPEVLVATDNQMRLAIRNMLRNFGVQAPQFCSSIDEIFSLTKKDSDSEQIIILDNTVPYMLEKISDAKEWLNANQKKILIFSSPTRKDIIEAMHAGISDVLTYPFSQEILEKKLRKLTNTHQANFFDEKSFENRNACRQDISVIVEAPTLSNSPLIAEDVSSGGFKVVVSERPLDNSIHDLNIQVSDQIIEGCKAGVAWVKKSEEQSQTWSLGLSLHMNETEQEQFSEALEELQGRQTIKDKLFS